MTDEDLVGLIEACEEFASHYEINSRGTCPECGAHVPNVYAHLEIEHKDD